jgi:hypothetical protein
MKFGAAVEQVVDYARPAADSGVIAVAAGTFNLLVSIEDSLLERVIRCHDRPGRGAGMTRPCGHRLSLSDVSDRLALGSGSALR